MGTIFFQYKFGHYYCIYRNQHKYAFSIFLFDQTSRRNERVDLPEADYRDTIAVPESAYR